MVLKLFTRPHNNFPPTANAKIRHFQTHLTFSFLNIFLIFLKKTSQHRKGIFFHRQSVFIGGHLHGLKTVYYFKNNFPPTANEKMWPFSNSPNFFIFQYFSNILEKNESAQGGHFFSLTECFHRSSSSWS